MKNVIAEIQRQLRCTNLWCWSFCWSEFVLHCNSFSFAKWSQFSSDIWFHPIRSQQVTADGEVTKTLPICFKDWLAKELTDLHTRAYCAMPENFPKDVEWKWEVWLAFCAFRLSNLKPLQGSFHFSAYFFLNYSFCASSQFNEEFERHLHAYMNMLVEVEAMDDCLKVPPCFH
jgi:hypothetical protein